jgi:septal ring factor EnvC (AmiA/AmiB activator)
MLAAALVMWADAKSLPTKLQMYANQIKATETTTKKNSESIRGLRAKVNEMATQQSTDTTKILNAIYRLKAVKPMTEIPDGLSGANNK